MEQSRRLEFEHCYLSYHFLVSAEVKPSLRQNIPDCGLNVSDIFLHICILNMISSLGSRGKSIPVLFVVVGHKDLVIPSGYLVVLILLG